MNSQKAKKNQIEISVIGAGIAGITTAFHLTEKGYKVNLIDPKIKSEINNLNPQNGSQAALGILMGHSYRRSKGRGFLLRKKSMKLWKEWLIKLDPSSSNLILEKPLIKLSTSEKEYQGMIEIYRNKKEYGIELLDKNAIDFWSSVFEKKLLGGLISYNDGRLNPIKLLKLFMKNLERTKVNKISDNVIKIRKNNNLSKKNWTVYLEKNQYINQDYVIICSSLNTQNLLKPLGHKIILEPVLGQVIDLELKEKDKDWIKWPAILNYQSINFLHYDHNHILMGATIENGIEPSLFKKKDMLTIYNTAPEWIAKASISNEWNGVRARPKNELAPLLKELDTGLLINTGHYRNGILLAPSCAEWIGIKIEEQIKN